MYESTTREQAPGSAEPPRAAAQTEARCPRCRSVTHDRYAFCPTCGTPLQARNQAAGNGRSRQGLEGLLPQGGLDAVLRDPRYRPALYMASGIFLALVFVQVAHAVAGLAILALLIAAVVYGTRAYLRRTR